MKKKSMCNQFYSDLVTKIEDNIDVQGTVVHVFYALKMGAQYEKRYLKHFAKPDICRHDYQHEELFFRYPDKKKYYKLATDLYYSYYTDYFYSTDVISHIV